jgi:hypothetical protein
MQKIQDIHHFVGARMNTDSSDITLKENEYRLIKNSLVSAPGYIGKLKKMKGFKNLLTLPINSDFAISTGYYTVVGSCEDLKNSAIVYFACLHFSPTSAPVPPGTTHGIFRLFTENNKLEWILQDNLLNFQPNHPVSAHTIDDLLYFTDGYEGTPFVDYNPPRKINMVKACALTNPYNNLKTYYKGMVTGNNGHSYRCTKLTSAGGFPADWELANPNVYSTITLQVLDRIKYPPTHDLIVRYYSDTSVNTNNVRGKQFQFRYQYVYDDNEKSVWSTISELPLSLGDELGNGNFVEGNQINNCINITFATGSTEVKKINIAVREGNNGLWKQIIDKDKYDNNGSVLIGSNVFSAFNFYNDMAGFPLDQDDVNRLYDFVPQISATEELIERNRIIDGDYIEGFDNIKPDVNLNYTFTHINLNLNSQNSSTQATWIWDYHRYNYQYASVPIPSGLPVNTMISLLVYRYEVFPWTNTYPPAHWPPPPSQVNTSIFSVSMIVHQGDTVTSIQNELGELVKNYIVPNTWFSYQADPYTPANLLLRYDNQHYISGSGTVDGFYFLDDVYIKINTPIHKLPQVKSGSTQFYGLQYYDRAFRSCGVIKNTNTQLNIPYCVLAGILRYNNPRFAGMAIDQCVVDWAIKHQPPMEAEYYSWVYGGSNIDWFLDFGVAANLIKQGSGNTLIDFNVNILNAKIAFPQSKIENYQWQEGDRIRFLAKQSSANAAVFDYFTSIIDKQILAIQFYPADDAAYERDDASAGKKEFIFDADGNKKRDISSARLVVEEFNKSQFGIPDDTSIIVCEVYRPKKTAGADDKIIYKEIGAMRPVLNPHTANRSHSGQSQNQNFALNIPATGIFETGDCYIKNRLGANAAAAYPVEALEFSDYYTNNSNISIGRPALVIENAKRNFYTSKLLYSGAFVQDTNINQLSTVLSSNSIILAEKYGKIVGMREIGYTLKVLQVKKHTSIPIGRVVFTQAGGGSDVVGTSKNVLGEPQPSDGNFGTTHNSGINVHESRVYFPDLYAGLILIDSNNGIHPISFEYKVDNLIKSKFKKFLEDGIDNISIYSAYDELYSLAYFSFIDSITPSESFTIAFKEGTEDVQGFVVFDFIPDFYGTTKNVVTSWKNGLWLHNDPTAPLMNFYGVQYDQMFTFIVNKQGGVIKDHKAMVITATEEYYAPNVGDLKIKANGTYREKQTKIPKGKFSKKEGKYYTDIPRNMLTKSNVPSMIDFVNGDVMRGEVMEVSLMNDTVNDSEVTAIETNSIFSVGT